MFISLSRLLTVVTLLLACTNTWAEEAFDGYGGWSIRQWTSMTSVYTRHVDPEPDHINTQNLVAVEVDFINRWMAGASFFDNSFGQNSQFVYMGRSWSLLDSEFWYFKLRGGLLHGYKEPYENKIPLNGLGVAPVIVPAVGFRYLRFFSELNVAGTAAVMFTVGVQF